MALLLAAMQAVAWLDLTRVPGATWFAEHSFGKPMANFAQVVCLPGWAAIKMLPGGWPAMTGWPIVIASALSSAFWIACADLVLHLGRIVRRRHQAVADPPRFSLARRRFLVEAPCSVIGVTAIGGASYASLVGPWSLRVDRIRVPIADLPTAAEGLRIVQITDTHYGPRVPLWLIREAVDRALALKPDIIALTGDYVHYEARHIKAGAEAFRPLLDAAIPTVGVLGNHDWYADGQAMAAAMRGVGVRMIDNDRTWFDMRTRKFTDSPASQHAICFAGVGDLMTHIVDVRAALSGVDPAMPRILLAHEPDTLELPALSGGSGAWLAHVRRGRKTVRDFTPEYGQGIAEGNTHTNQPTPRLDLALCGHTHGGQVRLPIIGAPLVPSSFGEKYAGGLVAGPTCPVVISRGVGMSILPIRIGVPPEITEITLTRASAATNRVE